jgi:hypothetical protein
VADFGERIKKAQGKFKAKGALEFLNDWEYQLGEEILVPKGKLLSPWWLILEQLRSDWC